MIPEHGSMLTLAFELLNIYQQQQTNEYLHEISNVPQKSDTN